MVTTTSPEPLAWRDKSIELGTWVNEYLVNRNDVYGAYRPVESRSGRSPSYTAPSKDRRQDEALTFGRIQQHFRGLDQGELIGLHAISKQNTSRWFVIDIDQHGDEDRDGIGNRNVDAAMAWYRGLRSRGFRPLLLDSNGAGGYHLLQLFNVPAPTSLVFSCAHWLISDYRARGFQKSPETFPKQDSINQSRPYGSWWRLPGRHHTRDHWTRVWNETGWVGGAEAIEILINSHGDSPSLIPNDVRDFLPSSLMATTSHPSEEATCDRPASHLNNRWHDVLSGRTTGGRHEALLQLAGHLLGKNVDPVVAEELCVTWNAVRNTPPKAEELVRQTVQDLVRRGQGRPARTYSSRHTERSTIILRPRT